MKRSQKKRRGGGGGAKGRSSPARKAKRKPQAARPRRVRGIPSMVEAPIIEKLTGLGERRLRQLAAEGFFPPAIENRFDLVATVQGVLAYYRDAKNRYRENVDRLKAAKLEREGQKLELELLRLEGQTLEASDVDTFLLHVATEMKLSLYQVLVKELPPRAAGRTDAELTVLGRETAEKLCAIFSGNHTRWMTDRRK